MKTIYLAARYSRREELCEYRKQLREMGFLVQARWLDGNHQLADNGTPIGESGKAIVEGDDSGCSDESRRLRAKFAQDDWDDVTSADIVISFTEPPRSKANRGGRHVEFGIALARGARVIVVGYRENIFHWLPQVEFVGTIGDALALLERERNAKTAEVQRLIDERDKWRCVADGLENDLRTIAPQAESLALDAFDKAKEEQR